MPFTYSAGNNKIIFTRESMGCIRTLIILLGAAFALAGGGMLLIRDAETPLAVMRLVFLGAGLAVIYLGIIFPKMQQKSIPHQLIFDNANGRIEIRQQQPGINTGYIYYDEVEDLIIKEKYHESSSDDRRRAWYTWHVFLLKKDGGEWELLKRASQEAAQEEITRLRGLIDLGAAPAKVPLREKRSAKYSIHTSEGRTELRWRNKPGRGPLSLIVLFSLFLVAGIAILGYASAILPVPQYVYVIAGFIAALLLLMIGINLRKMKKNAGTEYAVAVSPSALEYMERDLQGKEKKNTQYPLSELYALSFTFDADSSQRKLYIYTREQLQKKKSLSASPNIATFADWFEFYRNQPALDFQDLTPVELLHVENLLQQWMAEKSTRKNANLRL